MAVNHNNHDTLADFTESGFLGILLTWLVNTVFPFAVHTVSAILTGLITTTVLYFFQKWLRKKFK
jgi:hypothetical protein